MYKLTCKSTTFFLHTQIEMDFFPKLPCFFRYFVVFRQKKEGRYNVTPLFLWYLLRMLLLLQKGEQLRHRIEYLVRLREVFTRQDARINRIHGQARSLTRTDA